jgi:hypothetical protein
MKLIYYLALHESPRSLSLPKYLNAKFIELLLNTNLWNSFNKNTINKIKEKVVDIPIKATIIVEYDGNFIVPLALIYVSISQNKKWKIVLDAHVNSYISTPIYHFRGGVKYLTLLMFSLIRKVYVLVHNKQSKNIIPWAIYCPTPFPDKIQKKQGADRDKNILIISSLNKDEPVELFVDFAKEMKAKGFNINITGNYDKLEGVFYKKNSEFFTGYLTKEDYNELILNSCAIVSMTKRSFNLLYAPREAIVNNRICMINDSMENISFYGDMCVYSPLDKDIMVENIINSMGDIELDSGNLINSTDKNIYEVKEWLLED